MLVIGCYLFICEILKYKIINKCNVVWPIDLSTLSLCFNCKGQSNISNQEFIKNEQNFINSSTFADNNQSDQSMLFGHSFNKGHSLVYDLPILFRMAKYALYLFIFV